MGHDVQGAPGQHQPRLWKGLIWIVLAVGAMAWLFYSATGPTVEEQRLTYTAFLRKVEAGEVARVTIEGNKIVGTFVSQSSAKRRPSSQDGKPVPPPNRPFVTYVPAVGDDGLLSLLEEHDVEIDAIPQESAGWITVFLNLLPLLMLVGLAVLIARAVRSQGRGIVSVGNNQARLYQKHAVSVTFDDVAGARGAKQELQELISSLKEPQRLHRLGGKSPRGVLLVGPPGSGKTLLARATAGEADASFFSITGSDFMEMFVGVGASRVRSMFREAKKVAPSIIFIDELDSIGRRRGAGVGGGHDEREQTLNQLLSELDGFEPTENVVVLAATNRPDILDPALLRPGRFDRRVLVDLPTLTEREEILRLHARNKPLGEGVSLAELARSTPGFSGADLQNLLNEAALLATRQTKEAIEPIDIEAARDKVLMGLERESLALSAEECRLLAYHEAGHAVVAALLPHADPVHKVTIVPRSKAMGATLQMPEREQYIFSGDYMRDRLAVMMGGRAAEDLACNTATSGAAQDLREATRLARMMVQTWGMSRLGPISLGGDRENVFLGEELARRREYSEQTAREIDEEVLLILNQAFARARQVLHDHRESLERVTAELLEQEELSGKRVQELVQPLALVGRAG